MKEKLIEKKVTVQDISNMSIYEKLSNIQSQLKIPKSQYNAFSKFYYRSCENILEALKPILNSYRTVLIISDEISMVGTRFYVKATATLKNLEKEEVISVSAYAREEEVKKGMDGSQITGSSSSYARKYALNGLFGIDDSKDSDTTNKGEAVDKPAIAKEKLLTNEEMKAVGGFITKISNAKTIEELNEVGKSLKKEKLSVNQRAVLRASWGAKNQKLTVSKTK